MFNRYVRMRVIDFDKQYNKLTMDEIVADKDLYWYYIGYGQ